MEKSSLTPKILLIEDNEPISIAYQKGFAEAGFEIFHIENGEKAIEAIKVIRPDIILLDLIMPKRDGFEVLSDLKEHPELGLVPVIVLTNLEQGFYTKEVEQYQVADLLIKSENSISQIVKRIKEVLSPASEVA